MTKFVINKNHGDPITIEADSYGLKDGYFHFHDFEGQVATYKSDMVHTIDREP